MATKRKLSESLEHYLEAIYHISQDKGAARAKHITEKLNVNSSSVTGALQTLSGLGLVNYAPYELITLTDTGREAALDLIGRHYGLFDFFVNVLGIDEEASHEAACRMEHSMPRLVLERLKLYIDYVNTCPQGASHWEEGRGYVCSQHVVQHEICNSCEHHATGEGACAHRPTE